MVHARVVLIAVLGAACATPAEPGEGVATHPTTVRTHQPSAPEDAARHEADCAAHDRVACHAAALDHYYAHTAADDDAALARFRIACDAGYAPSCNGVGTMYAEGRAVPRDDGEAVRWFRAACASDASTGCEHLAQAYEAGRGVARDPAAAAAARARGTCLFEHSLGHDPGPCAAAP